MGTKMVNVLYFLAKFSFLWDVFFLNPVIHQAYNSTHFADEFIHRHIFV